MAVIHELMLWAGLTNGSGPQYLFWSGIAGDIWLTVPFVLYRKHNCHVRRCWRIGKFPLSDTPYVVCGRHHPDVTKLRPSDVQRKDK